MKQRFEKLVLFLVLIRFELQFSITVLSGMKSNIFPWNLLLVIIQFHFQVLEKSSDQSQPFHSWEDKEILKQTKLNMKSIIGFKAKKNFGLSYCSDICLQFCGRVESYYLNVKYYLTFGVKKCHFHKLLKICLTFSIFAEIMITLQSPMQNWLNH